MSQPSIAELREMAREALGRDLDDAELEATRHRLPTMIGCVRLLQSWEARLREAEPATLYRLPVTRGDDRGGT